MELRAFAVEPSASIPASGSRPETVRVLLACLLCLLVAGVALSSPLSSRHASAPPARAVSAKGLTALPLALRGVASSALGAGDGAYRLHPVGRGAYQARNPALGLRALFDSAGVRVSVRGATAGFALAAVGRGSRLTPLARVVPVTHSNTVSFGRGGMKEWWANGPLGLEQTFEVASPAAGGGSGPLTLEMKLSGNARASLESGGRSISFSRGGTPAFRYTGLAVTDAAGRGLHNSLALQGSRLLIRIDTAGARFPIRVDPLIQTAKLTGEGAVGHGGLGYSVALSSNGTTALVGGAGDNSGIGAVWVFTRSGSTWTQQAKLTAKEEVGAGAFGISVALSSTGGNTALIGGYGDNKYTGAAWVFTRTGSTWTQQAKLTAKDATEGSLFGEAVALSKEGETALIGGPHENGGGAAWVFQRTGSTWAEQARLTGSGETVPQVLFGESVALSGDGSTALVGGPEDEFTEGGAWVFVRSGTTWTQQGARLFPSDPTTFYDYFGDSVALSSDGNTALIGAPIEGSKEGTTVGATGAAWVFVRSGTAWAQQGLKLTGSGESGYGQLGRSVALSSDGNTAIAGAPLDSSQAGAAFVFARSGTTWSQESKLTGGEELGEGRLGQSVAVSEGGTTALAGGPYDNASAGAAWTYSTPTATITSVKLKAVAKPTKSPTVSVTGTGFGVEPRAFSAENTGCGDYGPANGDWFGQQSEDHLWFTDTNKTGEWQAGIGELTGSCVGIVVKKWSAKKVVFKFGVSYGSFGDWTVYKGDEFKLAVAGALWTGKAS